MISLAEGGARFWLAEPGSYLFTFAVVRDESPMWIRTSFWDEPQTVLEVRDDGTLQSFEVRAPSAATAQEIRDHVAEQD